VLFARKLEEFETLVRKAVRVIQYRGTSRVETIREQVGGKGYATGFEGLVSYINGLVPTTEVIAQALRRSVPSFPELALRELIANALIHQDFEIGGSGPTVELFDDRAEITNPGTPLIDATRFVDIPP
jgi:predicted HTH transcriptional regulator